MKIRLLLLILGACAAAGTLAGEADSTVQLRVLETTDIHVHIVDYDYFQDRPDPGYGLVRTAALIRAARNEVANSVLVDNGDLLQGNPLGDFIARKRGLWEGEVHPVYKAMNLLDYTVANIGNHEFNYGLDFLARSIAGANFPYISANVFHDDGDDDPENDEPYFDQYLIVDRFLTADDGSQHPIKIGFIGFVPPQILNWDKSHLEGRVVAHDMVDTARKVVPRMKAAGADLVIAIPHSGLATATREGMDENTTYYLSKVPDIDAILFGHSHRVFPSETFAGIAGVDIEKGTINGVPSTMPGSWGSHLGYVDFDLAVSAEGEWSVVDAIGAVRPIARREGQDVIPLVDVDEAMFEAVRADHEAALEYIRTDVGEITAPINSFCALVQDDPSVQIVTDAQKRYVERLIQGTEYDGMPVLSASAPFKTGGRSGAGAYTDIDAGPIALKDIADLYIYPNTLRAVAMTGAEVREWLEMSAGMFNQVDPDSAAEQPLFNARFPSFNFDVIDGVDYRIDITQPQRYASDGKLLNADSYRITELSYNDEPIDMEQVFIVATNNYRAGGGGGFPGMDGDNIVIEAPDTNRDVLAAYIFDKKTIDPSADGNWSLAPVMGDVFVTFPGSPDAANMLAADSRIEKLSDDEDGFTRYRLHLGH